MLVLTRRKGEAIRIGEDIVITVYRIEYGERAPRVTLTIEAPDHVTIFREELLLDGAADSYAGEAEDDLLGRAEDLGDDRFAAEDGA